MSKNGLTVGMMLWEEGETLEGVLESLKPIADRFVLGVDRRSTDETARIAHAYAQDYFEFDFHNHFSEVRNEVLRRASTRWFFQVDGHEFLSPDSLEAVAAAKEDPGSDVIHCALSIWDDREPLLMLMVPRIFRTDRGIRYQRAIHNTLTCEQGHPHFLGLPQRMEVGIMLDHRQPPTRHALRVQQRDEISVDRIRAQAEELDDAYDWYNLGVLLTYQREMEEAMKAFERSLSACERADARYQVRLHLAGLYKHQGDRMEARRVLALAQLEEPSRVEHLVELGALEEEEGQDDKALIYYSLATHLIETRGIPASQMTVHLPYFSYFPYERLLKIYGRKGDLRNALEVGQKLRNFRFFRHKDSLESYLEMFTKQLAAAGIL